MLCLHRIAGVIMNSRYIPCVTPVADADDIKVPQEENTRQCLRRGENTPFLISLTRG
jgi:hypothetical protein